MEFTQGNWHNNGLEVRSETGLLITDVYPHLEINKPKDQCLADAQLIAAAPELLEALKSCVLSMQSHPDCTDDSEFQAFVNKGWEVITKATKSTNQQKKPNEPEGFNEWIDKINNHVKKTKL